ncbi:hypothetical protein WOLCODRAFT_151395 [Wolfiporia cocos MD-104 SS10]|uniref:Uncharacterized protein n=1 Tax=Wolfiporia cocos (strain MD-104) TaxID=742152 RepID=A0A2H3JGM8_WOLCO|nr:hypothetical protein WOLCODRAFT_151395 [Wolfiporia cocos MD-104 SS10]
MAEVQDQPEPEWIRQERLADYEAIRAAQKAARSVPHRVETPKFLAACTAALAKIEWFKNAMVNIADYVPDTAAIQKDCFPATSHIATRNDSAPIASAVATQNDAAPTPDATLIISVHGVLSPPECSPPNPPPRAEMPLHSTVAFIKIVKQPKESAKRPDDDNAYNQAGAQEPDVNEIASPHPLKRTWQQMNNVEVGANQLEPGLTELRVIEGTTPEGESQSHPGPNMKHANDESSSTEEEENHLNAKQTLR